MLPFCNVSNYEFRKRKWREIEAPKSSTILKSDYNTNSGEIDHLADFIGELKSQSDFFSKGSIETLPLIKVGKNTTIKMPCDEDSRDCLLRHATKIGGANASNLKRWQVITIHFWIILILLSCLGKLMEEK